MKKNLLTSLKELLKALGGNNSTKTNIVGVVDEITEQVGNNKEKEEGFSGERFEVVCTPTASDFSGTMNKTMAEILEAYNAGCDIWFALTTSEGTQRVRLSDAGFANNITYPSFNTTFLYVDQDMLIKFHTGATNQADQNTYATTIYPLTRYDPNANIM